MKNRPISPFMIGPYYRPQLTSMLSIMHRGTGVFLSIVGAPLLLCWLMAIGRGPAALEALYGALASLPGQGLVLALLFSACYHFCNGIRHLIWDTGLMLSVPDVYRSGWIMLGTSLVLTALLFVGLHGASA